jgi:molybdopterin-guanine dinucleotide biosynthesis protein A
MKVSGIVLAGGRSSRMGKDKTLLSINAETLIERTVKELSKAVDEIIIASNQECKYNIPGTVEIPDVFPGMGPLGGIHAGLLAAKYPLSFVVAADMPFFTANLAAYLLSKSKGYDVVAPEISGCWEPLCAVYSRTCLEAIENSLAADVRKVYGFYSNVRVLKVSEEELTNMGTAEDVFSNLNTPEDYHNLLRRI